MQEAGGLVACLANGRVHVYNLESLARFDQSFQLSILIFWQRWKAFCPSLLEPGGEEERAGSSFLPPHPFLSSHGDRDKVDIIRLNTA